MPRALIDSSALIGGLPEDVLGALEQHCSSTIVRAELAHGLSVFVATGQISRAARRRILIDALDALADFWRDFDIDASEGYGRLTALTPQAMRAKDALIADGRIALGVSRGSPETALRGYEAFGYSDDEDAERGSVLAREKFDLFLEAIGGAGIAPGDPRMVGEGRYLPVEPRSATLRDHIWWGSGSRATAEETGRKGLNLMSSTLVTEATGQPFHELQREQIDLFRAAYKEAGHTGSPRVSVSRSVFPLVSDQDRAYFGLRSEENHDQIGVIDGYRSTFGKTYAAEPDVLIRQLLADEAVMAADTLMLTIPNQLGPAYNLHVLQAFAEHVAPALGWKPNTEGPVQGDPVA